MPNSFAPVNPRNNIPAVFSKRVEAIREMELPEMTPLDSSMLIGIGFNETESVLVAQFRKGEQKIFGYKVSKELADSVMSAQSVGKAMLASVIDKIDETFEIISI